MAVLVGQIVKRQGRDGGIKHLPIAANKIILEGTLVFRDSSGYATDVRVDANTVFLGVARRTVDNSLGVAGERNIEFWTDGDFELPCSGLAITDLDTDIFASDNYTTTKSSSGNPKIGTLSGVVAADVGVISIKGLGVE